MWFERCGRLWKSVEDAGGCGNGVGVPHLCEVQLRLPEPHAVLKGPDVGRGPHGLRLDDLVVQQHLDVVEAAQDAGASGAPGHVVEHDAVPVTLQREEEEGRRG